MSVVEHRVHNGGLAELGRRLHALDKGRVRVGYIQGKSNPQYESTEDGEKTTLTCAQVAAWNVYGTWNKDGTVHTPERNFMREGIARGKHELARLNRINLVLILRGQMDITRALGQLGVLAAGWVKRAIAESKSWAVPNAPRTIAKKTIKGKVGDQPLKDTGNMQQATTWVVE